MKTIITIELPNGILERVYDWDMDGDHLNKGELIEDMMASIAKVKDF